MMHQRSMREGLQHEEYSHELRFSCKGKTLATSMSHTATACCLASAASCPLLWPDGNHRCALRGCADGTTIQHRGVARAISRRAAGADVRTTSRRWTGDYQDWQQQGCRTMAVATTSDVTRGGKFDELTQVAQRRTCSGEARLEISSRLIRCPSSFSGLHGMPRT